MKTQNGRKIYSPSEINYFAKRTLEQMSAWIEGEISSIQTKENWHYAYFSIKDETDILACFVEPQKLEKLESFSVGKKVLLYGVLTLFKKNEYKMHVYKVEESGDGILDKRFKELYERLKKEGLFDEANKKPLPVYPHKICILASEHSAGWNDFKTHTQGEFKNLELITYNIRVEGQSAVTEIVNALKAADSRGYDVLVLTRGGGSSESLEAVFNSEEIARTIFALKTPSVVAIGHEVNTTLAELVADMRASTPTDAANIVVRGWQLVLTKLSKFTDSLSLVKQRLIDFNFERLDYNYYRLQNYSGKLNLYRQKLDMISSSLKLLSPQNTLNRGYSITYNSSGKILRDAARTNIGQTVEVKLAKGNFTSKITGKSYDKN